MTMFDDELIEDYIKWKKANMDNFSWWNYVNMKADLDTALAFAKFFYPDIVEIDGYFILKDKFSINLFDSWKTECKNCKVSVEKMMNLYQVRDFFHLNKSHNEDENLKIQTLANVLKQFWNMSFIKRYSNRQINVDIFEEDGEMFITVYEKI